jgi:hypothetical protein
MIACPLDSRHPKFQFLFLLSKYEAKEISLATNIAQQIACPAAFIIREIACQVELVSECTAYLVELPWILTFNVSRKPSISVVFSRHAEDTKRHARSTCSNQHPCFLSPFTTQKLDSRYFLRTTRYDPTIHTTKPIKLAIKMQLSYLAVPLFAAVAAAQSNSTNSTDLASLVAQLPTCALDCLESGADAANCTITDFSCICGDGKNQFIQSAGLCVVTSSCSSEEKSSTSSPHLSQLQRCKSPYH